MKPSQHTNGPWEILMNPKEDYLLIENVDRCDFHPVCAIYGEGKKQEANAQLIAAAPELLEACKSLVEVLDGNGLSALEMVEELKHSNDYLESTKEALAAITRATL